MERLSKIITVKSFGEAKSVLEDRSKPKVISGLDIEGSWAKEAKEAKGRRAGAVSQNAR